MADTAGHRLGQTFTPLGKGFRCIQAWGGAWGGAGGGAARLEHTGLSTLSLGLIQRSPAAFLRRLTFTEFGRLEQNEILGF